MTVPVIKVKDLVVEYRSSAGTIRAVDRLNLTILAGEVYALLGENGAGKTSTVEVIEGHRPRYSGAVQVLGIDPATSGVVRRELRDQIGIVLQTSGVEPEITPREALKLFSSAYRSPRPVSEVIELTDLRDFADQRIGTLSGGQRRRLDLAVAVIGRPKVLFLDEPTTGFDPSARRKAWDLISQLRVDGTTILLTTHYLDEAEYLADRVGMMSKGRMLVEGSPGDLQQAHGQSVMSVKISESDSLGQQELETGVELALNAIPHQASWMGHRLEITTSDTTGVLERLASWAASESLSLSDWSIERPSLEQVFLDLNADDDRGGADD